MLEVRQHLSETVQRELKVVLLNLAGARVLQGVFSRVVWVGLEPEFEAPAPRQPDDSRATANGEACEPSSSQNAQLQADIQYLRRLGAENIRVNQQQLTLENTQRVGINRPDLQFEYNHRRYHVEYDTPTSGRGLSHQSRTTSNDPNSEIILLIVP